MSDNEKEVRRVKPGTGNIPYGNPNQAVEGSMAAETWNPLTDPRYLEDGELDVETMAHDLAKLRAQVEALLADSKEKG